LDWLIGLVEARLGFQVDGLEAAIDRACGAARREHMRLWPHDFEGGETAAVFGGAEEAASFLARVYIGVLEWTIGLLDERMGARRRGSSWSWRSLRQRREPVDAEVPLLVAEELTRARGRFGWPRGRAA
jgi:hypothetical protein